MAEDWRLHVRLGEHHHAIEVTERLQARELENDVMERIGGRIVVSRDGPDLFLYAETEAAAREAEGVVRSLLDEHEYSAEIELRRWHPDAEEWEPLDKPLPQTEAAREAEREDLMEREDEESAAEGIAEWEVRIELPSRHDAAALERQLEAEGFPITRRFKYVLVGATDEEAANELAGRLRGEAPQGSEVTVEGTFPSVQRKVPNPFAFLGGLGN
ncbi:MAG: hypothetical protein ACJ77M_04230 [Thermoleophilaceae bacterium]|jgi:hypothetical protein